MTPIVEGEGAVPRANQLFASLGSYFLFTIDYARSVALTIWISGGRFGSTVLADQSAVLPDNTLTIYVEANGTTGVISFNTSAYTGGSVIAIGRATTSNGAITNWIQDYVVSANTVSAPTPAPAPPPVPINTPQAPLISLLLHGDGANASTIFNDEAGHAVSRISGSTAAISTADSQFGGSSIRLNGDTGLAVAAGAPNLDFVFAGDYTVSAWVNPDAIGSGFVIFEGRAAQGSTTGFVFWVSPSGMLSMSIGNTIVMVDTVALPAATRTHVELSRVGSTTYMFKAGALIASITDTTSFIDGRCYIGQITPEDGGTYCLTGYLDEVLILNGQGLHRGAFTPPVAPYRLPLPDLFPNAQTGTTYTYRASDAGKLVSHSNAAAIAGTLPQAGTAGFEQGFAVFVQNRGAGALTITPATSTIDGATTLVLRVGQGALIVSDGTNYFTFRGTSAVSVASGKTLTASNSLSLAGTDGKTLTVNANVTLAGTDGKTLTTSNSITLAGTDGTVMTFPSASAAIGYMNKPINSQSVAYALVLADQGKGVLHPSADTTARTITIPANASVAFPVGTHIDIVNQAAAGALTIAITTDTLTWVPSGSTGSRTLAANGWARLYKITATAWIVDGVGLS